MAALIALTLWQILATAVYDEPLLIEALRLPVPPGVRHVVPAIGGGWYLSDQDRHLLLYRTADGRDKATVGGYGWGLSALDHPGGVATDGVRLYVADEGNHRVTEFDRELRPLSALTTRDTSDVRSRFGLPKDVALSDRGDLFVLDGESEEVVCFASGRRTAFRIGRDVPGGLPLRSPACIAVDDQGQLLIGELGGIRVLDLFGNQVADRELDPRVQIRGIAGFGGWTAAVSADTLYLFDVSGVVSQWSRRRLASGEIVGEFRDVAWDRGLLLVLAEGVLLGFHLGS